MAVLAYFSYGISVFSLKNCGITIFEILRYTEVHGICNFGLKNCGNKSRQKFHHSLKEHHKITNIPKFRCEML